MGLAADRTFSSIFTLSIGRRNLILTKCGMPHFCKMDFYEAAMAARDIYHRQRIGGRREGFPFCSLPLLDRRDGGYYNVW